MSTAYPGALDSFTSPTTGDYLNSPSHVTQHVNVNGAVAAIETKIGTGSATPAAGKVLRADGTGTSTWGAVVNADVDASAAIALSKLATGALPSAITVASANLVDGTIVDADVNASAAIGLSKLATGALPTGITVASANLVNGTIVNDDVNASAAITESKILFATGGHGHTGGTDGKQITVNRAFTWYLDGTSIDGVMGAKYIAPQNMTVVKTQAVLTSGTCTATLKAGTTVINAISCSNSLATDTSITAPTITAGDVITLTLSSSSSPVGLIVTCEMTQP